MPKYMQDVVVVVAGLRFFSGFIIVFCGEDCLLPLIPPYQKFLSACDIVKN